MTKSTVSSLEELLASLDVHNKTAVTHPNPPTSGPGSGTPDTLTTPSEGARMSEHKANIRDMVGVGAAENAPSPTVNEADLNPPGNAAVVAPTGGDSAGSSSRTGAPTEAEPGTSQGNLKISQQLRSWQEDATGLLVTLMQTETKQAVEAALSKPGQSSQDTSGTTDSKTAAETDDFYLQLSNGDAKLASQARAIVEEQLVQQHLYGKKMAHATLAYLNEVAVAQAKLAEEEEEAAGGEPPGASEGGSGEASPPSPPPAAAGPAPEMSPAGGGPEAGGVTEEDIAQAVEIMSQQTGQPPEQIVADIVAELEGGGGGMEGGMGGGMGGDMGGESPEVVDEALVELADEMGVQPEELAQMLAAEEGGAGGGMPPDAGGAAAPAMPPEPQKTAAAARRLPQRPTTKLSAVQQLNRTRQKIAIKRRALEVLAEQLQRGAR